MATDSILRLKAQILAEAGVPYSALEKEIGVARRTIQRWGEVGDWKTPWKINQLFEKLKINDKLTGWMMGPKGPLRVRLMYDYLVAGAVDPDRAFALACQDADQQAGAWRDGAVYPVLRNPLTESAIGQSSRMQELGIEPETRVRQNDAVVKRTSDDLTQQSLDGVTGVDNLRAKIGEIGDDWQENDENGGNGAGNVAGVGGVGAPNSPTSSHPVPISPDPTPISPKSPQSSPNARAITGTTSSPLDVLLRATEGVRQNDAPRHTNSPVVRQYDAVGVNEAGRCGVPIEDYVPTVGEKERAASILEVLPRDFEGFVQVVRDSEGLSRAMTARAGEFQDNVSATLLKLSQYALQLAETDPRKALIVMNQIKGLAQTGQKTFKLDEEKDANKASDAMRRAAQKEEDGDAGVVLDV